MLLCSIVIIQSGWILYVGYAGTPNRAAYRELHERREKEFQRTLSGLWYVLLRNLASTQAELEAAELEEEKAQIESKQKMAVESYSSWLGRFRNQLNEGSEDFIQRFGIDCSDP